MANGPVWGLCLLECKGEPAAIDIDIDINFLSKSDFAIRSRDLDFL